MYLRTHDGHFVAFLAFKMGAALRVQSHIAFVVSHDPGDREDRSLTTRLLVGI